MESSSLSASPSCSIIIINNRARSYYYYYYYYYDHIPHYYYYYYYFYYICNNNHAPHSPAQESLDPIKLLGCAIGIGGVFLYSIVDNIFPPAGKEAKK